MTLMLHTALCYLEDVVALALVIVPPLLCAGPVRHKPDTSDGSLTVTSFSSACPSFVILSEYLSHDGEKGTIVVGVTFCMVQSKDKLACVMAVCGACEHSQPVRPPDERPQFATTREHSWAQMKSTLKGKPEYEERLLLDGFSDRSEAICRRRVVHE